MIGGALARPVDSMPGVFPRGGIFDRLPYLLPNLFSAVCVFMGVVIGVLFLEETHAKKKLRRDRGLELGNYMIARVQSMVSKQPKKSPEEQSLLDESDEPLPGYSSAGAFRSVSSPEQNMTARDRFDAEESGRPVASRSEKRARTFNKTTILIIVTFGILAL